MTDQEIVENVEEVVQESSPEEQTQESVQEEAAPQPVAAPQQYQPTREEINIKQLRASKERLELERDELAERVRRLEKNSQPVEPEEPQFTYGADDLIEGKHLSAIERRNKKVSDELNALKKQIEVNTLESQLRRTYSDVDSVVTKENMDILESLYPELVVAIRSAPDVYTMGSSAYTLIKKFGIDSKQESNPDQVRAQANIAKPKVAASVGSQSGRSPLALANAISEANSDEEKMRLYRQTLELARNR